MMEDADWDDNGMIDYEEFLRALHPRFNEAPVTPTAMSSLSPGALEKPTFNFETAAIEEDRSIHFDEHGKSVYDRYLKKKSGQQTKSANALRTDGDDEKEVVEPMQQNEDDVKRASSAAVPFGKMDTMVVLDEMNGDHVPKTTMGIGPMSTSE